MTEPPPSGPVSPDEELRRAVRSDQLDELGKPNSAAFSSPDLSVDVAGLAPLMETRERFPAKWIALFPCRVPTELGAQPVHEPTPDNKSHAVIPGRLSRGKIRQIKSAITNVIGPLKPDPEQ